MITLWGTLLVAVLVAVALAVQAVREEYLVLMELGRGKSAARWLLERRGEGEYQILPAYWLPLAIARFGALSLQRGWQGSRARLPQAARVRPAPSA